MAERTRHSELPIQAGAAGRILHTALALGGWALFVYWWWLVFRRVSRVEVQLTLLFIGFALVVIVLLTVIWALHNARIHRMRGPRTHVRLVTPDFTHDRVGREVRFPTIPVECLASSVVRVRVENGAKVYAPGPLDARPARLAERTAPR
jgi:hypothetical protein